jgi:hypothetical protein
MKLSGIEEVFTVLDDNKIRPKQISNMLGCSVSTIYRWKYNPEVIEDSSRRFLFIIADVLLNESPEVVATLKHAADYEQGTYALFLFLHRYYLRKGLSPATTSIFKEGTENSLP